MIQANATLNVHNSFCLELYDKEGNLKQTAHAYNLVLNQYVQHIFEGPSYVGSPYRLRVSFQSIAIGTGTGTLSPTRTTMFNQIESVDCSVVSQTYGNTLSTLVVRSTFPASSAGAGIITEVGTYWINEGTTHFIPNLSTHAFLQDAEGHTITIDKTDTDTLIVTATIYATIETTASDFVLYTGSSNYLIWLVVGRNSGSVQSLGNVQAYISMYPDVVLHSLTGSPVGSYANRTATYAVKRIPSDSTYNDAFANFIVFPSIGHIKLPNADVFPPYMTANTLVGYGDGSTTVFTSPIPEFIEDSEVVKVAGVTLTRGTDYTIDNRGNSRYNLSAALPSKVLSRTVPGTGGTIPDIFTYTDRYNYIYRNRGTIMWDAGELVDCNTLYLGPARSTSGTISAVFTLEYSLDNETWTTAFATPSQSFKTSADVQIPGGPAFTFPTISARYWRFSISGTGGAGIRFDNTLANRPMFGYVGQGIVFTTPPAYEALITIAAQVDRPWKTADYVIDLSATLTL